MAKHKADNRELASYACLWKESKGRDFSEPEAADRTPFQRDRDRVIHSEAFRRLQHKTQVYFNVTVTDHIRTRLTHSLEVAQIARTACRTLHLDEDLGEAVALSHDLGHPPFGHAGEDALNECMEGLGGFNHNIQAMRILRKLENRYCAFDGLNLTWESMEGISKHNGPLEGVEATNPLMSDMVPDKHCSLEGQLAAIADDIAYNHHDLDDGLHTGMLTFRQIMDGLPYFARMYDSVQSSHPSADESRLFKETIKKSIGLHVQDLLKTTQHNIVKAKIQTVDDVRNAGKMLVTVSPKMEKNMKEMKSFMYANVYRNRHINAENFRAFQIVKDLFDAHMNHKKLLPPQILARLDGDDSDATKALAVADYISMMTDRSAVREHARLYGSYMLQI